MVDEKSVIKGRCLCGETTYEYTGKINWCCHCHCESCRRNTSSPFTTFFGVPLDAYQFTGKTPGVFNSSPGQRRLFCTTCGTPMAFESTRYPHEIHFYVASLENPEILIPQFHVHVGEKLAWIELNDDLPKHVGFFQKSSQSS